MRAHASIDDRQLGDHAQVDRDPVALARRRAPSARWRARLDVVEQLRVGDRAGVAGLALPEERDLVAVAGLDVAVDAVVGRRSACRRRTTSRTGAPTRGSCPTSSTSRGARAACRGPEASGSPVGLVVDGVSMTRASLLERRRRRERAPLGEQRLERHVRHRLPPRRTAAVRLSVATSPMAVRCGASSGGARRERAPAAQVCAASSERYGRGRRRVGAEAGGIGEGGGFGDPAAAGERLEVADGGACVPAPAGPPSTSSSIPSARSHSRLASGAATSLKPARAAACTRCSTGTSEVMSCEPGSSSGSVPRSCAR